MKGEGTAYIWVIIQTLTAAGTLPLTRRRTRQSRNVTKITIVSSPLVDDICSMNTRSNTNEPIVIAVSNIWHSEHDMKHSCRWHTDAHKRCPSSVCQWLSSWLWLATRLSRSRSGRESGNEFQVTGTLDDQVCCDDVVVPVLQCISAVKDLWPLTSDEAEKSRRQWRRVAYSV